MEARFVYMTAGSMDEARRVASDLIERRLAACVNLIDNMRSLYHWQGKVEEGSEVVMIAKTQAALVDALTARVGEIHSYDCPCVVALAIDGGNPDFIAWIGEETAAAKT